jgi:hypothetical protein
MVQSWSAYDSNHGSARLVAESLELRVQSLQLDAAVPSGQSRPYRFSCGDSVLVGILLPSRFETKRSWLSSIP